MAQFHGFRCKNGYDEHGNIVYRAICPILDNCDGIEHLASMSAKDADVRQYVSFILSYYEVKAIDAEVADYLFLNAFSLLIFHIVEIEGNHKEWWSGNTTYYQGVFHPWWVENHVAFEAEVDDYFASHPFVR